MNLVPSLHQANIQISTTNSYWCHICRFEFKALHVLSESTTTCPHCKNDFCEKIDANDSDYHPRNFVPYDGEEGQAQDQDQQDESLDEELDEYNADPSSQYIITSEENESDGQNTAVETEVRLISSRSELNSLGISQSRLHRLLLRRVFGPMLLGYNSEEHDSSFDAILQHIIETDPNTYGTPPVSKKVLERLPTIKITKEIIQKEGPIECAVCKEEFKIDEDLNQIPCAHRFHKDCITPWLKQHNSCPVCRFELPTDDVDYENKKLFQIITNRSQRTYN